MSTYIAANADRVKVGDQMIFDSDTGEELVVNVSSMIRIVGESGREIVLFANDGVVLAVDHDR